MPQDDRASGGAFDWLAPARGSLAMARQPKPEEAFWEDYCFQAQQAAEKAIKAIYQHQGLVFRRTHDIEELAKGLEDKGVEIPEIVKESVILAKYASETRYPGTYEPVSEEEYQEAVRLAQAVVDWAESLILG